MGGSDNLPIGPGLLGFIAVFVLALTLWFLMRNMNSRLRRMSYRERDRQASAESAAGGALGAGGTAASGTVPDDRATDEGPTEPEPGDSERG